MAVPWVRFTENALVPKIMLQFQNGDTSWHQGDSAGIFMYSAGIFETFVKKILCPRASPMCSDNLENVLGSLGLTGGSILTSQKGI